MKKIIYLIVSLVASVVALVWVANSGCAPKKTTPKGHDESIQPLPDSCVVNVFIENSGSMDGYLVDGSMFKDDIYNYISLIKQHESSLADSLFLNLYYINSTVIPVGKDPLVFIKNLTPVDFARKGGSRSSTDIQKLLDMVIKRQNPYDINILISDYILSPNDLDPKAFLGITKTAVRDVFVDKLKQNPDFSVMIYHMESEFTGKYYPPKGISMKINGNRPYYMFIFGNQDNLARLKDNIDITRCSGFVSSYSISKMTDKLNYGILNSHKIGHFIPGKHSITKAKVDNKNPKTKFAVSMGVDYSSLLLDDSYLCNPDNYEISNAAYTLSIKPNSKEGKYTHILTLSLNHAIISKGDVSIKLKKSPCSWADEYTDNDGSDITQPDAMKKTFGLKSLIDGIYEAYSTEPNYINLRITIN